MERSRDRAGEAARIFGLLALVVLATSFGSEEALAGAGMTNLAHGMPYWLSLPPEPSYPDQGNELTDGVKGGTVFGQPAWQGHLREQFRVVTIDLQAVKPVREVVVGFLHDPSAGIFLPDRTLLQTSVDGHTWTAPVALAKHEFGTLTSPARYEAAFRNLDVAARYVRVVFFVEVWVFVDEIEVWGEDRIVAVPGGEGAGGLPKDDPYLGPSEQHAAWRGSEPTSAVRDAYFPPGHPGAGGVRHMVLIYTHGDWLVGEALPYVAYAPRQDPRKLEIPRWEDWFFDAFLFLALYSPDGKQYGSTARGGEPATWRDWLGFLDRLFTPNQQLDAFEQAVARAKQTIDDPGYRAKVVVMIPYPIPSVLDFGDVDGSGRSLSFAAYPQGREAQRKARFAAIEAYVGELERRWRERNFEHLELVGLYWLAEELNGYEDLRLVQDVSQLLGEKGLKLFWIPHFGASGWARWEEAGFDVAIYQPNYMFNDSVPLSRLREAAEGARRYGMGVEIEADATVLTSADRRERYLAYLRTGAELGFMTTSIHAYYQERRVLLEAWISTDPAVRGLYDATYAYVKGVYEPDTM